MPRPDHITRLHEADYDRRTCDPFHEAEMRRRYQEALAEAVSKTGVSEHALMAALAEDFSVWRRQQGLPKPSRRP